MDAAISALKSIGRVFQSSSGVRSDGSHSSVFWAFPPEWRGNGKQTWISASVTYQKYSEGKAKKKGKASESSDPVK